MYEFRDFPPSQSLYQIISGNEDSFSTWNLRFFYIMSDGDRYWVEKQAETMIKDIMSKMRLNEVEEEIFQIF